MSIAREAGDLRQELFSRAFDRDEADIIIEVLTRGERQHVSQDGGKHLIGGKVGAAIEGRKEILLPEFLTPGRVDLEDSIGE